MIVTVDAPASLPRRPAAVEVAAYRIATEAVTNSARHSGTDLARVCIELDDGCLDRHHPRPRPHHRALDPRRRNIVHAERAAEVGGTVQITGDKTGSQIRALLPLS